MNASLVTEYCDYYKLVAHWGTSSLSHPGIGVGWVGWGKDPELDSGPKTCVTLEPHSCREQSVRVRCIHYGEHVWPMMRALRKF